MSNAIKVKRGDVVLLPISFVSGTGTKVRPALVVQDDSLNSRLNSTVVAIITTTNKRAPNEPTQLSVDVTTPDGRITRLLHNSTVKGEHLDTVDQRDVFRVIGRFTDSLMQ
jgi:mRNA-degrading endonuclease toxin of MazEF toxin-antitoxin module